MPNRQDNLLVAIVENYTKTAEPVGSKLVAQKTDLKVSAATVRNEMAKLEHEGLIYQPHLSAGRVPTGKGFQYYVNNFLAVKKITAKEKKQLAAGVKGEPREALKNLAKNLAELSNLAVVVAFSKNDIYYTGLANLFAQPEFYNHDFVCNMSAVIDHLDKAVEKVFDEINDEVKILIGKNNPFGQDCSVVLVRPGKSLIGILGPRRMNYQRNVSLLNVIKELT